MRRNAWSLLLLLVPTMRAAAEPPDLSTVAERSGFVSTGRMEEVERLCAAFHEAYPDRVRCDAFGTSPEGRPMLALVASQDGVLEPAQAREKGRPVILVQGGIHAGEIDGKDAGFLLLREILEGHAAAGALEAVTLVFVPVFNVDGHERFGPNNRPNQVGPVEMGWRTTAQNLNLNRDYVKADAPEMQAMLRLLDAWDPIVLVDLHVTDGAEFQHDVAVLVDPSDVGPEVLAAQGRQLRSGILARLTGLGHLPLPFYPSFRTEDDPTSGFAASAMSPRFSNGYWGMRERLGVLVETHSWKDYATRVRATHDTVLAILEAATHDAGAWTLAAKEAESQATLAGGHEVPLAWEATQRSVPFDFLGVAYTREPSAISGGLVTRYRPDEPEVWTVPFFRELTPSLVVTAPRGGYLVPAAFAPMVAPVLALHGIQALPLSRAFEGDAEAFRATKATFATAPFEGRFTAKLEGAWAREHREAPAGSLFVPIAQPRARLLMTLLEPRCDDSLAAWGMFNACFERKEYMETYVAEEVAERMLAADPALAAEFTSRLASDAEFAHSPSARLEFFFRRHPSWDERVNLYPILRLDARPVEAVNLEATPAANPAEPPKHRHPSR
jgi:hypothetical protein